MTFKDRPQATKDQLFKINKILQKIRKEDKDVNDRKFIDGALLTLNLLIEDKHDKFFEYFDMSKIYHQFITDGRKSNVLAQEGIFSSSDMRVSSLRTRSHVGQKPPSMYWMAYKAFSPIMPPVSDGWFLTNKKEKILNLFEV